MTITPDQLVKGQTHFTTRGIAEIQDFYTEDNLDKVRIRLYTVDIDDGVTATGESLLMSTTPDSLCGSINRFPRDIAERKRSVSALKDLYPSERERVDSILARIQEAEIKGPTIKQKREKP